MSLRFAAIVIAGFLVAARVAAADDKDAALFANGDVKEGHALVDRDCTGCHVRIAGDADRIYTRDDRRVRTPAQLRTQITYCNTQLGTGYFPDEEEHVAAYLNQRYYRFKR